LARRGAALAKKSLVIEPEALHRLVKVGRYRNESEAVRAAVAQALAISSMQDAVASIQRRGSFGRKLKI
jgi:Arc/MetJ-type ribon-helix-helix transcriptional regulator